MKRVVAVILSMVICFTSIPFWGSSVAYATSGQKDNAILLDAMATHWIETCSTVEYECDNALIEFFFGNLTSDLGDYGDLSEFTKFTFELSPKLILSVLQSEDEKKAFQEIMNSVGEASMEVVIKELTDFFEEKDNSIATMIRQNIAFLLGSTYCHEAISYFEAVLNTHDLQQKEMLFAKGAKYGTIGCGIAIEDVDTLIKHAGIDKEKIKELLLERGVEIATSFSSQADVAFTVITITADASKFLKEYTKDLSGLNAYINGEALPSDNINEFLSTVVNQFGLYELKFKDYNIILTKYNGYLSEPDDYKIVNIPEEGIYDCTIVKIDKYFAQEVEITEVTIPSTVQEFGAYAFNKCTDLRIINYNAPAVKNKSYEPVFYGCSNSDLTIVFGEGIESIPCWFMKNCGISSATFPEGIILIEGQTFLDCPNLNTIVIPSTVTSIVGRLGYLAKNCPGLETIKYNAINAENKSYTPIFYNCASPQLDIEIDDNVKTIPCWFMQSCGISSVTIPEGVTTLMGQSFLDCPNLQSIIIPSTVTSLAGNLGYLANDCASLSYIEYNAIAAKNPSNTPVFANCSNLGMELSIGQSVDNIPGHFMKNCGLKEVLMPEGVLNVDRKVFLDCSNLTVITIPTTVNKVSYQIVKNAPSLTTVNYNAINATKTSTGALFENCTNANLNLNIGANVKVIPKVFMSNCGLKEVAIPEGVTEIKEDVFANCSNLTLITIPSTITKISKNLVTNSTSLTTINYNSENAVKSSNVSTFTNCTNPELSLVFGEKVKTIPKEFIENCTLKNISYYCSSGLRNTIDSLSWSKDVSLIPFHKYEKAKADPPATCTLSGKLKYYCVGCSEYIKEETKPLGHEITIDEAVGATCVADGLTEGSHCSRCNYVVKAQEVVTATGHLPVTQTIAGTTSINGQSTTICKVCNELLSIQTIPKIASYKLSYTKKAYTGKSIKPPTLTITDSKGRPLLIGEDYTVKGLVSRKKVGRYAVKINLIGDYSDEATLYYTIVPKKVSGVSATLNSADISGGYDDIKFSWKKSAGASGYLVYYKKASALKYTFLKATTGTSVIQKNLSDGVKYTFKVVPYYKETGKTTKYYDANEYKTASTYTLKKVSSVKLTKTGAKVKVKWTNIQGETGYQISKSTKKTGTNIVATYKTTTGKSKSISITKGKMYYFKVRAYKTVGKRKVYGPWSVVRIIK